MNLLYKYIFALLLLEVTEVLCMCILIIFIPRAIRQNHDIVNNVVGIVIRLRIFLLTICDTSGSEKKCIRGIGRNT